MIFGAPMGIAVEATGVSGQQARVFEDIMVRLRDTWEIAVEAGGARGGVMNAIIARAQANRRRNPFYINERADQAIRFLTNGLTSNVVTVRVAAAKQIGAEMLKSIAENVQRQANPDGSGFAPLTSGYAMRKQKKFGFIRPILRASGDLLGGLRVRVNRQ